ncbi:ubiquitin carboxyl-terminal hydrolase (macronuclear) [Tetrahymena thermophila SB210]|uniref:ubiquitinyl hydrolase 1 n=1 Tax=Tetrahymena thermophila (strain SB210) TaxID=312017 RepID=I7MJZ3_TETTS|nr:ubiquitin carboxyl-terminal hydrolase [Tetrahymena thermophila SB210]EAR97338.1 ubiquitin carboxyl-terminal hydrolase [Tetrahymena thermophila SB210]|eukprot:XP_001017583.1 ubiquitin carboxyl-terminal hydrolase [Tetrahymena thermophila SB210]
MSQQSQKTSQDQQRDLLIDEAQKAHKLIIQSDQKFRKQLDIKICYLISRNWFNQWCEYVGYLEVIADLEPESEKFALIKPNRLINEEFISQQADQTLNISLFKFDEKIVQESKFLNILLKQDQNLNTFKIVDEETWKFFSSRYPGGFEISRPVFHYQHRIIQNVQLLQPEIVVYNDELVQKIGQLSDLQLKNGQNPLNFKRCQLPSFYTLSQLKDLMKRQFNVDKVRVWRFDASQKKEEIQLQTGKQVKQKQYQIRARELVEQQIGGHLVLQDIIKNHYCLIIELPIRGNFQLIQSSQSQIANGKFQGVCEYCTKILELSVRCVCKQVAYCSQNCKYKDQDFHSHTCDVAADSESDEEMNSLPLEISGKAGLKNIGNTCYLAAALQNIYITSEFSQKFTMNEINSTPNKKCKLLQKFSKLLKEMTMLNEESIEPWSFKTQLGQINQMFSGNYQHDAAEFITCLFDAINEECQKDNIEGAKQDINLSKPDQFWSYCVKQGYNKALIESFLGLYESSIECPECQNTSLSYDPFTILSLPIKQKPIVKQIMVNLIKENIALDVIHTKTSYTTGKTTILDLILFVCQENQIEYKNNIVVCTYNGESIQQAYIKSEQLQKNVEDLETELEGKNKSLLFYEVSYDLSTFDPLKHKLIKMDYSRMGKTQIGIMQVDEKTTFSAPRVIIVERQQNMSSIYKQIFSGLSEIYPEAYQLVKDSFAEYKEIQLETEQDNEQQNTKSTSLNDLEEQRKKEDAKWNGASNTKDQIDQKQQIQQQNNGSSSNQKQSPPKQQQQQIQQNQISINDGWGDFEIPTILPKKQNQQQKSTQKQQTNQKNEQQLTQPTQNQQLPKQPEKKQQPQALQAQQSQTSSQALTQASSNSIQSAQSTASNDGGWGWDSEIYVAPKKAAPTPVQQKPQVLPSAAKQVNQQQGKSDEDDFTQVTQHKKGKNSKQNNKEVVQEQNTLSKTQNLNQQNNSKNNQNKASENQKQNNNNNGNFANQNGQSNQKTILNGQQQAKPQSKQQQQQNIVNPFATWGDEDQPRNITEPEQEKKSLTSSKQLIEKQQQQSEIKVENQNQQEESTSNQNLAVNQNNKPNKSKTVIQKEDFSELLTKLPFSVNIKSKKSRIGGVFKCYFCGKQNCQNCTLPFENQRTFSQLLQNYRDLLELELFWQKEQPPKTLYKSIIDQNQANSQAKKQNLPNLQYCLEEFSQKEQLSKENAWYCSKCQKQQQAFKKLSIKYAPNNLIIQIKRFKTNIQDGSKEKNYQQVIFPEYGFSLQSYADTQVSPSIPSSKFNGDIVYDLYGLIIHEGTTENGHYIAQCKYDKIWYSFDDDNISIVESEKVLNNKNAYILFYRLRK